MLVGLLMASLDTPYIRLIDCGGKVFQFCFIECLKISPVEEQQGDLRGRLFWLSRAFTRHNTKRLWSDHDTKTISALNIGEGYRFKRVTFGADRDTAKLTLCTLLY